MGKKITEIILEAHSGQLIVYNVFWSSRGHSLECHRKILQDLLCLSDCFSPRKGLDHLDNHSTKASDYPYNKLLTRWQKMKIVCQDSSLQRNRGREKLLGQIFGKAKGITFYTRDFNQLLAMCTLLTT